MVDEEDAEEGEEAARSGVRLRLSAISAMVWWARGRGVDGARRESWRWRKGQVSRGGEKAS